MRDPLTNKLFGATLLSGVLSGITVTTVPGALLVGPGLLFGLATSWVLHSAKWFNPVQVLLWIAASTGAWYVAIRNYVANVAPSSARTQSFTIAANDDLTNMVVAGLIGSALLALAFSLIMRRLSLAGVAITVVSGAVLAAVMHPILEFKTDTQLSGYDSLMPYVKMGAAFAIWQIGAGLSLLAYKGLPRR